MAKKKDKKEEKVEEKSPEIVSKVTTILKDERTVFFTGVFLLFLTIYLLLAFVSFLFTWKADNIEWINIFSGSDIIVDNFGGKLGAALANKFIYQWFGLPSFGFIFLLAILSAKMIGYRILPINKTFKYSVIAILWLSILFGSVDTLMNNTDFLIGGAHGFFISQWLNSFAGKIGTIFILLVTLLGLVFFNFPMLIGMIKTKLKIGDYEEEVSDEEVETEKIVEETEEEKASVVDLTAKEDEVEEKKEEAPVQELVIEVAKPIDEEVKEEPKNDFEITDTKKEEEELVDIEDVDGKQDEPEEEEEFVVERKEDDITDESEHSAEPLGDYDPTKDLSNYKMPLIEFLEDHDAGNTEVSQEELNENKDKIVKTLENYKIKIDKIKATIGPTVTLYEIVPAPGVRISKIKNLEDDIALSLAALGIRIIAPMPGRGTVGIEVPNANPEIVSMKKVVLSKKFQETKYDLPVVLGKTISNETYIFDLAKSPHMLVAGATGQGKSVGINAILTSLLYKKHPSQLKFVLIDPKMVELSIYSKIEKHYLAKLPDEEEPIITDVKKVIHTLNSLAVEMDDRYKLLKAVDARNIKEYNAKFIKRQLNPNKGHKFLPYIVLVIDEFADLIMTAGKEIETPIARIAQKARAIGIHMIVATQRPSTNIITGVIKANFPARMAFKVSSMIDSRTILDSPGANNLIGRGDLLITDSNELVRVQCAFVDTPEVDKITKFISQQQGYPHAFELPEVVEEASEGIGEVDTANKDSLFEDAARLIVSSQQGSTSSIQRKFSIGYNRAGRIMDQLEALGIVGPYQGSKPRQVLYPDEYSLEQFLNSL